MICISDKGTVLKDLGGKMHFSRVGWFVCNI